MLVRRADPYRIQNTEYRILRAPRAFSLLELLVALGVVAIAVVAILGLLSGALEVLQREQHRRIAIGIAEERLELIRNVPYDDVGTTGGIPPGAFPPEETVERNGVRYAVATRVRYIDDPFDRTAPTDAVPNDYREVAVDVAWGMNPNQAITLASYATPLGIEASVGGGTLRVRVFDARGEPVDGARIQVTNGDVTPPITLALPTDRDGTVELPGAPASSGGYHIRVTKDGFSADGTTAPNAETPNPTHPPLTVLAHDVTATSFAIDRLAAIHFTFVKHVGGQPFRELMTFTLRGTKTVGSRPNPTPPPDALPVYKAGPTSITTDRGELTISQLEWDTYELNETMANFDLAYADPPLPITLLPGTTQEVTIGVAPHHEHALRVTVRNTAGLPLANAAVTLAYDGGGRQLRGDTPPHGQVYFAPLDAAAATLTVSHPSFQTATRNLTIGGQMAIDVRMEPP